MVTLDIFRMEQCISLKVLNFLDTNRIAISPDGKCAYAINEHHLLQEINTETVVWGEEKLVNS